MKNKNLEAMLFGYMIGDGWLSITTREDGSTVYQSGFSGDESSLKNIKHDLMKCFGDIGKATIRTEETYSPKYEIRGTTSKFVCNVKVTKYFIDLGMPIGKRVEKEFSIPKWIINGSDDIKKNFISGFYSAEGSTPLMQSNDRTIRPLVIIFTKRYELKDNLILFANQLCKMLNDFGIETRTKYINTFTCAKSVRCEISIPNNVDNILKMFDILDLRYCIHKMEVVESMKSYYKERQAILDKLALAYDEAMLENSSPSKISKKYSITVRQVAKWKERRTGYRIPNTFPKYSDFIKMQRPILSTINSVKQGKNSIK